MCSKLRISSADRQEMGKKSKRRGVIASKKCATGASRSNGRCGGDDTAIVADTHALLQVPAPEENGAAAAAAAARLGNMSLAETKNAVSAKLCSGCGKKSDTIKLCNGCQCVWYCNSDDADCQERHRDEHEKECRRIKEELDKRGGKLDVGTELGIGPLEKLPPRKECPICRCVMPIHRGLTAYFECCGNTACQGCFDRHILTSSEMNLKRSRDLEREVPPLPEACPFCRTALPKSDEEMLARYRKRVELKDPKAMFILALGYGGGSVGLPVDHAKCIDLLCQSADRGCLEALCRLGNFHYYGTMGLEQNEEEAIKYYQEAAESGDLVSLHDFGCCSGDEIAAMCHFRFAASGGYRRSIAGLIAFFQLGLLYHNDLAETLQAFYLARAELKSEDRDKYIEYLKWSGEYIDDYDM